MQRKNLKYLLPIVGIALVFAGFRATQPERDKENVVFSLVRDALTSVHLQPREVNDELSQEVYAQYLESLDYNKLFLTAQEVNALNAYSDQLDDALTSTNTQFFDLSYDLIQKGIERSRSIYQEVLSGPLDLNRETKIFSNPEKRPWASDENELRDYWTKHLQWRIVNRIYEKSKAQEEDAATDKTVEIKPLQTLEEEARKKELELQEEWYDDLIGISRIEWFGMYMNAYCESFDPHTSYLAPRQNEDFELSMTGQFEGIGAQLKKEGDYITIERIIAGSACWRQGDLEVGDKILSVGQAEEEPIDVVGWKVRDAIDHIRGKKGTEVRLTVKKKDGSRQIIPIIRDVVELESTFARSAVLDGTLYGKVDQAFQPKETLSGKVGYIRLPKFYVDFYKENNRNAAEDVKNEILHLKEQGITSLILDLRSNGGGSLQAAIEIAGLFTEMGPMVQVKNFQSGTRAKKNKDANIYWDGPLVVLVNNYSASASEIVSAALQDRKRALIVGPAKSTFGKGTVQNMFDFDRAVGNSLNALKPLGAIKITTEKFYRISGGTTQLQGVIPDISLPGAYDKINIGEKEYTNALAVDFVERAKYDEDEWGKKFDKAIRKSEKRISNNATFQKFTEYADWIEASDEDTWIPLSLDAFSALQDSLKLRGKEYKNLGKSNDSLGVMALPHQLLKFEQDSAEADIYQKWFKNLSQDIILHESVKIAEDLQ